MTEEWQACKTCEFKGTPECENGKCAEIIREAEKRAREANKTYELDRKTIKTLLEQRDKLAQEVEQLRGQLVAYELEELDCCKPSDGGEPMIVDKNSPLGKAWNNPEDDEAWRPTTKIDSKTKAHLELLIHEIQEVLDPWISANGLHPEEVETIKTSRDYADIRIRKVAALEGHLKSAAAEMGFRNADLLIVKTFFEKVKGSPTQYLLSRIASPAGAREGGQETQGREANEWRGSGQDARGPPQPVEPAPAKPAGHQLRTPRHEGPWDRWHKGCENCGSPGAYDQHQLWGLVDGKVTLMGYSCEYNPPPREETSREFICHMCGYHVDLPRCPDCNGVLEEKKWRDGPCTCESSPPGLVAQDGIHCAYCRGVLTERKSGGG